MDKKLLFWLNSCSKKYIIYWSRQIAENFPAEQTLIFTFRCFQYQECYSLHIWMKNLHFLSFALCCESDILPGSSRKVAEVEIINNFQFQWFIWSQVYCCPDPDERERWARVVIIQQLGICNLSLTNQEGWRWHGTILCLGQSRKLPLHRTVGENDLPV